MTADFLSGVIFAGSLTAALFFLRFWRQTADRLFAIFSLAFTLFAVNRLLLAILDESNEARTWVYVMRLVSFVLIIAAVADKNRARTR
jgi:uncharacterized membrane protein HdeD (DUF308 family)